MRLGLKTIEVHGLCQTLKGALVLSRIAVLGTDTILIYADSDSLDSMIPVCFVSLLKWMIFMPETVIVRLVCIAECSASRSSMTWWTELEYIIHKDQR